MPGLPDLGFSLITVCTKPGLCTFLSKLSPILFSYCLIGLCNQERMLGNKQLAWGGTASKPFIGPQSPPGKLWPRFPKQAR